MAAASLSRQMARFAHHLGFPDLPPSVVDKVKALTLHFLASAIESFAFPDTQALVRLVKQEEAARLGGCRILVEGARVSRGAAAFINGKMHHALGDTYQVLTHPGRSVFPGALAAADGARVTGEDFIAAAAAGYEVQERITGDFVPSVAERGFHPGAVFAVFGAAVACAKLLGLDEDQLNSAIALAVSLASGNAESGRGGGSIPREGASARNGVLAALLASAGVRGGESSLEGDGGLYHAFAGSSRGTLRSAFCGPRQASLERTAADLGQRWEILETLHKVYPTAGYNGPHVEVTARLCAEHDIRPDDVAEVELVVNWLEARMPEAFPAPDNLVPRRGSSQYFAAYGVVQRGFPAGRRWIGRAGGRAAEDPPEVLDLMRRIRVVPSTAQRPFAPRITVRTHDGVAHTAEATGREFMWDFAEEARRIRALGPHLPVEAGRLEALITAVEHLEELEAADRLIDLTIPAADTEGTG